MAASSSSAAATSSAAAAAASTASKRAAQEELNLVEGKLEEINRQLQALEEERDVLLARQAFLKEQLNAKTVDVDWSGQFPWAEEVMRLKGEVFQITAPFRPLQREAINCTISGQDCFVIMRTGGGKSLVYQLPALLDAAGLSVVISPLISLISDQVYQLEQLAPGKAAMLTGSQTREEGTAVMQRVRQAPGSGLRLLYVTPEKVVKSKSLLTALEKVNGAGQLSRIVVDEAHCCSEWGHEYRPDYARLGLLRKIFPQVPILAVTATATPHVIRDVSDILSLRVPEIFRGASNRPNLFYCVRDKPADNEAALKTLARFVVGEHRGQSGIVYCYSQKESETVAEALNRHGISAAAYHAGLDAGVKDAVLRRWTQDRLQVVSATIAFGMGISKADVRFVVHYSISKSAESYIQESGRAGRDGQPSTCLLLYRASDAVRQASLCVTERMGLKKLRAMVEYAQQASQCRRLPLARALGERLPPNACGRGGMCDVCSGATRSERIEVTGAAKAVIALVRAACAKDKGRITHRALAEAFVKEHKKKLVGKGRGKGKGKEGGGQEDEDGKKDTSGGTYLLEREAVERLINQMTLDNVLGEDYHASMYSINTYCVIGYQAAAVERGERRVWMEVVTAATATGAAGDRLLPAPAKRPASAASASASAAVEVVEIMESDEEEEVEETGVGKAAAGWEAVDDGDGEDEECEEIDLTEDGKGGAGGGESDKGKGQGKGKGRLKKRRRAASSSSSDEWGASSSSDEESLLL